MNKNIKKSTKLIKDFVYMKIPIEKKDFVIEEALSLWPENPLAKVIGKTNENIVSYIKYVENELEYLKEDKNKMKLHKELSLLLFSSYRDVGLSRKLVSLGNEIIKKYDEVEDVVSYLALEYCKMYEVPKAINLLGRLDIDVAEDLSFEELITIVIFSVLSKEYDISEQFASYLVKNHPNVVEIFDDISYSENIDYSRFPRRHRDEIIVMHEICNRYVYYLERDYCFEEIKYLLNDNDWDETHSWLDQLDDTLDFFVNLNNEIYDNIGFSIKRSFIHANLLTKEDFAKLTEKQVLAMKGVGPVTVRKLKENGVKFKGEK